MSSLISGIKTAVILLLCLALPGPLFAETKGPESGKIRTYYFPNPVMVEKTLQRHEKGAHYTYHGGKLVLALWSLHFAGGLVPALLATGWAGWGSARTINSLTS